MVIKLGLDMGNKNLKVYSGKEAHEIPIAYREKDQYWYENETIGDNMEKVKYKNRYYLVGVQGRSGLPQNKGDKNVREVANMFKLVGLARELRLRNETEGEFYIVTGTPLNDYQANKQDYLDLMISKDGETEIIELDGKEYKILVSKADVTKQAAVVAPTLENWKDDNLLLVDLGGGTLDIAYFVRGTQERYMTIDFPLNELLEQLGNTLNGYGLGLPRPDELDSGFLLTMEEVILNGSYVGIDHIDVNGEKVNLKGFCDNWLQSRVNSVIEDIKTRLNLSDTVAKTIRVHYLGGGAKLLREQLINNNTFGNKEVTRDPHFANVKAYNTLANVKGWD